jgi:hypothetical protein
MPNGARRAQSDPPRTALKTGASSTELSGMVLCRGATPGCAAAYAGPGTIVGRKSRDSLVHRGKSRTGTQRVSLLTQGSRRVSGTDTSRGAQSAERRAPGPEGKNAERPLEHRAPGPKEKNAERCPERRGPGPKGKNPFPREPETQTQRV